jgi:hypothetical protein
VIAKTNPGAVAFKNHSGYLGASDPFDLCHAEVLGCTNESASMIRHGNASTSFWNGYAA